MLFIVIHQVYELWFKQLLHELAYLQRRLEMGDSSRALATLKRVLTILKTVVAQIDVLETMTPAPVHDLPRPPRRRQRLPVRAVPRARGRARPPRRRRRSTATRRERRRAQRIADAMARAEPAATRSCATWRRRASACPRAALERDVTEPAAPSHGGAGRARRGLPRRRPGGAGVRAPGRPRRGPAGVALPPRQDGRAHDRRQGRAPAARRARRTCARRSSTPLFPDLWAIRCEPRRRRLTRTRTRSHALLALPRRRAAAADRALAPGVARRRARGPGRGLRRRRARTSTRSGGGRSPRPSEVRAGFARAARRPRRRDRPRREHPRARRALALGARPARAAAARDAPTASSTRCAASSRGSARRGSRSCACPAAAGGHAGRAPGRRASTSAPRAVLVSAVLFETARIVAGPRRRSRARARRAGAELLVDAYHALGARAVRRSHDLGLGVALVVGGGYKYLQLGEGNCFLRVPAARRATCARWSPAGTRSSARSPTSTTRRRGALRRGADALRRRDLRPDEPLPRRARVRASSPSSGLTPERLRASYRHQVDLLAAGFDALGARRRARHARPRRRRSTRSAASSRCARRTPASCSARSPTRGVLTDSRGPWLRLGPAPYLSDAQLEAAIALLGEAVSELR